MHSSKVLDTGEITGKAGRPSGDKVGGEFARGLKPLDLGVERLNLKLRELVH